MASDCRTEEFNVDWQSTKNTVLQRNGYMLNNPFLSDVVLACEGSDQKFFAHKYVLCTSSNVFHAMFGHIGPARTSSVVNINTDAESLWELLRFLYTDECTLTMRNIVNVMLLAKRYNLPALSYNCVKFFRCILKPEKALSILEQACYFNEQELVADCWRIVEACTSEVIASDDLYYIRQATLVNLLKRDKLQVPEVDLFRAVLRWAEYQCSQRNWHPTPENMRDAIGNAMYEIRFLSMTQEQFAQVVSPSRLLATNELVAIYDKMNGVDSPDCSWIKAKRGQAFTRIKCPRLSSTCMLPKTDLDGEPFTLSFSVNQDVTLHGVRLLAGAPEANNKVTLYVSQTSENGASNSENNNVCPGYVMFKSPVAVKRDSIVKLKAVVQGHSFQHYEVVEKNVTDVDGVVVRFNESYLPCSYVSGTYVSFGEFYEIILSV